MRLTTMTLVAALCAGCGSTARPSARGTASAAPTASSGVSAPAASASAAVVSPGPCTLGTWGGGWAGARPYWPVDRPGSESALLFAELTQGDLRSGPLVTGSFLGMVDLPNGGVALPASGGTRVLFTSPDPKLLSDGGRLTLSPKRDLLAITSDKAVVLYDVATWKRLSSTALPHEGTSAVFTPDERYLVELSNELDETVVIDVASGAIVLTETGFGGVSPAGKTLALLRPDEAMKWTLRLVTLGPKMAARDVSLSISPMNGLGVAWDGEARVDVLEIQPAAMMSYGTHLTLASVDVANARVLRGVKPLVPFDDGEEAKVAFDRARVAVTPLLPVGRTLVEPTLHSVPFTGPTASGLVAAGTSASPGSTASSVDHPGLVVADTKKKRVLAAPPLPESFSVQVVRVTDDERFVLACGTGTFIVDVATGRTALRPDLEDCFNDLLHGTWIWSASGILDLTSDEADPHWPASIGAPDAHAACPTENPR